MREVLLDPALPSALEAAVAAAVDVTLLVLRCDKAEPAADFADLPALLSRKTFDADEAALLLVISDFAIAGLPLLIQF